MWRHGLGVEAGAAAVAHRVDPPASLAKRVGPGGRSA